MGFTSEYHSKPLRFLKKADRVLQKEIESFLQRTELQEYTFQFVKPSSEEVIKTQIAFMWERPVSYRSYQLILNEGWAAVLVNAREPSHPYTARIPLLRNEVRKVGPIVLECLLDESDRILWIVDVLHSKGENTVKTLDFIKRYQLCQKILASCIQSHAVLQSCEVKLAPWKPLHEMASMTPTPKCCIEMVGLNANNRRYVWRPPPQEVKKNIWDVDVSQETPQRPKKIHKQTYNTPNECAIIDDEPTNSTIQENTENTMNTVKKESMPIQTQQTHQTQQTQSQTIPKNYTIAYCSKDPKISGPDLYVLEFTDGTQLGSAAIRSMQTRLALRKAIEQQSKLLVNIEWYTTFNKYEIKSIVQ